MFFKFMKNFNTFKNSNFTGNTTQKNSNVIKSIDIKNTMPLRKLPIQSNSKNSLKGRTKKFTKRFRGKFNPKQKFFKKTFRFKKHRSNRFLLNRIKNKLRRKSNFSFIYQKPKGSSSRIWKKSSLYTIPKKLDLLIKHYFAHASNETKEFSSAVQIQYFKRFKQLTKIYRRLIIRAFPEKTLLSLEKCLKQEFNLHSKIKDKKEKSNPLYNKYWKLVSEYNESKSLPPHIANLRTFAQRLLRIATVLAGIENKIVLHAATLKPNRVTFLLTSILIHRKNIKKIPTYLLQRLDKFNNEEFFKKPILPSKPSIQYNTKHVLKKKFGILKTLKLINI